MRRPQGASEGGKVLQIDEPTLGWLLFSARLCLASVYLVSGIHKALFFAKARDEFLQARVPATAILLPLTIFLHLIGSAGLISGVYARESALLLALFTLIATIKAHAFWRMTGAERLDCSRIAFANLAIVGGLLILAATGPGRLAL
jgi:putative oxidoreductase